MKNGSKLLHGLLVVMIAMGAPACAASADDAAHDESNVTGADETPTRAGDGSSAIELATAFEEILELAPAGEYKGTTSSGAPCTIRVTSKDVDSLEPLGGVPVLGISVVEDETTESSTTVIGSGGLGYRVNLHPAATWIDSTSEPETTITRWKSSAKKLSFSSKVVDGRYQVETLDTAITDLKKPHGSAKISFMRGEVEKAAYCELP